MIFSTGIWQASVCGSGAIVRVWPTSWWPFFALQVSFSDVSNGPMAGILPPSWLLRQRFPNSFYKKKYLFYIFKLV